MPSKLNINNSMPVLSVSNLAIGYEVKPLLQVGSLQITRSEIVALVGVSGVGKTSLLSCLTGELQPLSGTFSILARHDQSKVGTPVRTLQAFPLFHWLTVGQNLALSARIRGKEGVDIDNVLSEFSALKLRDRFPDTLSGGERCRASLSQALVAEPDLLLLDEPFVGLDYLVKREIATNIIKWVRSNEAAMIYVTHDLYDAAEFADRIIVLSTSVPAKVCAEIRSGGTECVEQIKAALMSPS